MNEGLASRRINAGDNTCRLWRRLLVQSRLWLFTGSAELLKLVDLSLTLLSHPQGQVSTPLDQTSVLRRFQSAASRSLFLTYCS